MRDTIQDRFLNKKLATWYRDQEQIDDICVMGVRV